MPVGNGSSTPADWSVTHPPPPPIATGIVITGALMELAGATCLLMETGQRGNLTLFCFGLVLAGLALVLYGVRGARNGACSINSGERYNLPAMSFSPCPLTWTAGSVVTFYADNGTKTGAVLESSEPITDVNCTVRLVQAAKAGEGGAGSGWLVELISTP